MTTATIENGAVSHLSALQREASKTVVDPYVGIFAAGMKVLEVTEDRLSDAVEAKPPVWRDLSPTAISDLRAIESPQVVFDRGESRQAASR